VSRGRLAVVLLVAAAAVAFFAVGGHRYLSLENLKAQQAALQNWRAAHPAGAAAAFFAAYVAVTGLSLPGAALLTLAGGALFGLLWGTVLVSFASSIGATLAFLASRFVLRDWVQRRYGAQLRSIDRGVEKEGGFYLFTLRLLPAVPFFVINLAMGLTRMRVLTFYWVSQLGMLAGTLVYVYAGTQLAGIGSLRDVVSPGLIGALLALGVFPLAAKKTVDAYKARRVYARWERPARFERNLVVIGAGSAGLVSAYIAAAVRAKVTLVEKHRMGGDCLNTGCVPSKALLRSAKLAWQIRNAEKYGIRQGGRRGRFCRRMERVERVIRAGGAARLGRALREPRGRVHSRRRRKSPRPGRWKSTAGSLTTRKHRHRRGRASDRAADSRNRSGDGAHLGQPVDAARAAAAPRGARRAGRSAASSRRLSPGSARRSRRSRCCRACSRARTPTSRS
jgi:uncharacterized membrane protein YdjX (TVP38/TMEM64 family)